jgi:hypothetical protein
MEVYTIITVSLPSLFRGPFHAPQLTYIHERTYTFVMTRNLVAGQILNSFSTKHVKLSFELQFNVHFIVEMHVKIQATAYYE